MDLFIATYSEDTELVRLSIRDALKMAYPYPIDYRIHVLDDGRRPEMKAVCDEEGVNYISRQTNIGFKAGNLRNGLEQTDGDFIVICDADTRVFPTLLSHTLGYFRDPDVACRRRSGSSTFRKEKIFHAGASESRKSGLRSGLADSKVCWPGDRRPRPVFNDLACSMT